MKILISLLQHIGKPAMPIVKEGEMVNRGQLIAVPNGLGANVHSSVQGIVEQVTENFIEIHGPDDQPKDYVKIKDTFNHLETIKEAGIVGAGGAGFPTHIKLSTSLKGGFAIANAAECEPNLRHNIKYIEENPEIVVKGLKYVMEITSASKGIIAIKPKNKRALINIAKIIKDDPSIEIKYLSDMYPSGDERVIVRELLGVELKPGQLPLEANAVICNVETLKNITLAIEERKPVIDKDITVGGRIQGAESGKVLFDVPIGTIVKDLIKQVGKPIKPHGEYLIGGAFTGFHGYENSPITKTSGGIALTMPFPKEERNVGLLLCECGGGDQRLREIAEGMGANVVASTRCKRMVKVGERYRCDKPGVCPGQAEKVLELKKNGAEVLLIGSCQD
ncbi:proline reductase-associated electron transfer protein PrdC [Tepidimicrobium xylanilyticum]